MRKRYHPPLTPYQRLFGSELIDETIKRHLREQFAALDPVALLKAIRVAQQELLTIANRYCRLAQEPSMRQAPS